MTLWIKGLHEKAENDKPFSEILIHEAKKTKLNIDLSTHAPLFDTIHPQILKLLMSSDERTQFQARSINMLGWHIYPFKDPSEAKKFQTKGKIIKGTPAAVFSLLNEIDDNLILDFENLGCALFSKTDLKIQRTPDIYSEIIFIWSNYALSPELWGHQGKWTRFHERAEAFFKKHGLLKSKSIPGYYELSSTAKKLESFGIIGDDSDGHYTLTLSWTFSLTALKKLESVIFQEF